MGQVRYIMVCSVVALCCLSFTPGWLTQLEFPAHFPGPVYDFTANPLNEDRAALGKILFYDEVLSGDGTVSCASCHSPFSAFAHTDHALSHGIEDRVGQRNAPALFNLAWATAFHHDGAHHSLELQPLAPIHHEDEMGSSIQAVVGRLSKDISYLNDFEEAFGESKVSGANVLKALAQFQLTLVSAGAKYDQVRAGRDVFSKQEARGQELFTRHCNSCHAEPLFTTYTFERNGLEVDPSLNDYGRMNITGRSEDSLRFKVPSLRNLSFTHPYMHDGRFEKLRQVLNHYATRSANPLSISPNDQSDLIAFLLTLDDRRFVFNERFRPKASR